MFYMKDFAVSWSLEGLITPKDFLPALAPGIGLDLLILLSEVETELLSWNGHLKSVLPKN